jgi:DNA-binding LytR/AlgR family response regulator
MGVFPENKISALIVEDNLDSLNELKALLSEFDHIQLTGEARDGDAAVTLINSQKPDLLFLDIELPGLNGFEVLKNIDYTPMVIFVSAYDQYAVKAFEANGIDYILKPVSKERLHIAVDKVVKLNKTVNADMMEILAYILKKKHQEKRFFVKQGDQILIIPQEDVFYFKAEEKYLFLHTDANRYFYDSTLKKLEASLDPSLFLRVNRGHIVSTQKILGLKKSLFGEYKAILNDSRHTPIKISKYYLPMLKKILNMKIKI